MRVLFSLFVVLSLGCETIVEIDAPEYDSKPVVTSFFTPDTPWSVTLHQSLGANEKLDVATEFITDATVKILNGSSTIDILRYGGKGKYMSSSGVEPLEGMMYTLRVDFPKKPSIEAVSMAPLSVDISDYSIESLPPSSEFIDLIDDLSRYQLRVVFSDRTGLNYYRIGIYRYRSVFRREETDPDSIYQRLTLNDYNLGWSCGYVDDIDVAVDPVNGGGGSIGQIACEEFVVTDRLFDGKSYSWSGITYNLSRNSGRNELLLIISSLSEDYYEYLKSLERNEFYDPLIEEPFPMYSNVNDGLGVFAGYTNTRLIFPIFQEH